MIPVFEPDIGDLETSYVLDALRRGEVSGTFGEYITRFEEEFAAYCGRTYGIAVSSGTSALQLAVAAARIGNGEEVLMSASTNIATALAAYHEGAIPIPIDSEIESWNLDPRLIENSITSQTRAIIPVHLYGNPVDMDPIMDIARRYELVLMEDCAQAHGAIYKGKKVGSFGEMSCFSFYANKVITTGEGGMVLTDDAALAERLRLLRNVGFSKPRFVHQVPGYNFRMTGLQAALGCAQLKRIESFIERKRLLANWYSSRLQECECIHLPIERSTTRNVYWMYSILIADRACCSRDELCSNLAEKGIETRTFFCPLNQQPFLRQQPGFKEVPCPVADQLWQQGMYLPSGYTLTESHVDYICSTILEFLRHR